MAIIRGYWVVQADESGQQDMRGGAPMDAYYGYGEDDRVITFDGVVVRGSRGKAESLARQFAAAWREDGHEVNYTVAPLDSTDYFGAYHDRVADLVGARMPT